MKKYLNYAFGYAIAGLLGGVFYSEFTKFSGFSGVTVLGKVHTHLLLLGMIMFMLVALFAKDSNLEKQKTFSTFMIVYNIGVILTATMMVVRGVLQVREVALSTGLNASISGVSGIGHILVAIGLFLLFHSLKKSV